MKVRSARLSRRLNCPRPLSPSADPEARFATARSAFTQRGPPASRPAPIRESARPGRAPYGFIACPRKPRSPECNALALPGRMQSVIQRFGAGAHRAQVAIEAALGRFSEDLARRFKRDDAIGPEVAEVAAQPAPRTERPDAAPECEAQRLDLAPALARNLVAIGKAQHVAPGDRLVQAVNQPGFHFVLAP